MKIGRISTPIDIAVSGLKAEGLRMNVIANNIANSNTAKAMGGQPYRRQEVVLTTTGGITGVQVSSVSSDQGEFKRVFSPGSPDADSEGFTNMPNVDLPVEMMHLVTASRAYQANAAVMKRYQEANDTTLELLK